MDITVLCTLSGNEALYFYKYFEAILKVENLTAESRKEKPQRIAKYYNTVKYLCVTLRLLCVSLR